MSSAILRVGLVFIAVSPLRPQTQPPATGSQGVVWPGPFYEARPLYEVARLLKDRYRKAVTYEEPIWLWHGDSVATGRDPDGPFDWSPKDRRFVIPDGLQRSPDLHLALLKRIVEAYNTQNNDGTLFQATESRFGMHIVPRQMHNAQGELVAANNLLDAPISVPPALRMPSEHFQALCDAVTAQGSGALRFFYKGLDIAFEPNGLRPPKAAAELLTAKEKEPYSMVWGASDMPAREALLRLIDLSATKWTWYLLCHPSAKPEHRFCVLNMDVM